MRWAEPMEAKPSKVMPASHRINWVLMFGAFRFLFERRAGHVEIRLRVPAFRPTGLLDARAEEDRVVQVKIVAPDELRVLEVSLVEGFLGIHPFLGVFSGVRP